MVVKCPHYNIYSMSWIKHPTRAGQVSEFVISTEPVEFLESLVDGTWDDYYIARFPIGPKYSESEQEARAQALCKALNAQVDAINQALEHHSTLSALKL